MTRSESNQAMLYEQGATPVVADALDPDQVAEAVGKAKPDVIIHELTAIPDPLDLRHFDRDFALTNRLRTEGTDHLLSAGQAVGIKRFIAQSYAAWPYERVGGPVKSEDDPLDPSPAREMRQSMQAIRHVENAVLDANWTEGIVLRYGAFYGPGTNMTAGSAQTELVRKRKYPVVGNGGGVWSFIHIADAAEATVGALDHGTRGIYNIVDDDPAPVAEWLPALAQTLGARKPMRVPRFIGRVFAGEAGVVMMTELRGASNDKAKRELQWRPAHPSWREGFATISSAAAVARGVPASAHRSTQAGVRSRCWWIRTWEAPRQHAPKRLPALEIQPAASRPDTRRHRQVSSWSARWLTSRSAPEYSPSRWLHSRCRAWP